ncbi:Bromodomain and WD repeat-containing protein 1 [Hondaea fermentalgiana]|uniref:Bromodomain and WD repeat-containing protein 1 n=1 Tax=Hondaea fermentalgiana TaxID=2315210 RepID=A0A2R5G3T8_9STRA|nr:Bromodomain and WD repeat-containing protein 1 [Hondaea fermentalgiana]|eukprot:GBG24418.1 Bromodomain and WD repeat-containing protein 1 [Hondaea fermentalgiana]
MKTELSEFVLDLVGADAAESTSGGLQAPRILCQTVDEDTLFLGLEDGRLAHCSKVTNSNRAKDSLVIQKSGHSGAITCLRLVSNCGGTDNATRTHKLLFTGSVDRTIKVWCHKPRRPELECIQTLVGHGGTITALEFGGGFLAQRLVSCSTDRTIRVWTTVPNRELLLHPWFETAQIIERREWITSTVLGPRLERLQTGLSRPGASLGQSISVSPGSTDAESSSETLGISSSSHLYHVENAERFGVHDLGIFAMEMIKQLNLVVTAGYDNCVRNGFIEVWNIYTDKRLMCHRISTDVHRDENVMAESKRGEEAKTSGLTSLRETTQRSRDAVLTCTVFCESTPGHFSAAVGGSLYTWTMLRDLKYKEHSGHDDAIVSLVCFDESPAARSTRISAPRSMPEGSNDPAASSKRGRARESFSEKAKHGFQIFSASLDNTLRAWDWYDMKCLFKLREPQSEMTCLTRLPDSGILATGNEDGTIRLWSCDTGSTMVLRGHKNTVLCLDVAERRRHVYLLSAGYDGNVGIWDVTLRSMIRPKLECMFEAHKPLRPSLDETNSLAVLQQDCNQEILCIRYNPAGAFPEATSSGQQRPDSFLTGGNDCVVRVWHFTSYIQLCALEGHTEPITCLEIDANFVISGSDDGSVRVWNLANLREGYGIAVFSAHQASVRAMVVLSGQLGAANLVTCSFDGAIRVWDYTGADGTDGKISSDVLESKSSDRSVDTEESKSTAIEESTEGRPRLLKEFCNSELQFRTLAVCERHDLVVAGTQQGRLVTHSMRELSC